jgi:hypothetical protein
MRVLLLGLTGAEPAFAAWEQWLVRAGVPHDAIACKDLKAPLRFTEPAGSSRVGAARYQALILSDPGLLEIALEPEERDILRRLERELGLRRLIAYAYPGPEHGLQTVRWSGPLDQVTPVLTETGREVFPYLRERLPVDPGSWAYLAAPESPKTFQTLVAGPDDTALVGIHRHPDGREEMLQTFDANLAQVHGLLLRRGQLAWLTRGAYVGYERHYLSIQIDDVLLANHSWSVGAHRSDRDPSSSVRMTAADAARAGRWARARGLRLDLACNGGGSESYARDGAPDPLLTALLEQNAAFGWINHTFRHADIDELDQAGIEDEIARNVSWAAAAGVALERAALVTGAHTGLANLAAEPPRPENEHLRAALRAQRIQFVGCDASRPYPGSGGTPAPPGTPFSVGVAFAIPRHPTALPHDAVTPSQVLDRLRSQAAAGDDPILSFDQVVCSEGRGLVWSPVGNDPRPHYFHQSNMIGGGDDTPGIVYTLLDAVLDRYREYLADDVALLQPTLGEIGRFLLRLGAWQAIQRHGSVETYREPGAIVIENRSSATIELPITGTTVGERYGTTRSGWMHAAPGSTRVELDE